MSEQIRVLIVSKGHDYDHSSFLNMFADCADLEVTLVEHPAATIVLNDASATRYDVVFFYDMCGVPGLALPHDDSAGSGRPSADYEQAIEALVARGTGLIAVNHATVSWANWPLWRELTGSSFMLTEGELHGKLVPGSGYRGGHGPLENATVQLRPARPASQNHPVLDGLPQGFEITDELYLKTADYGDKVVPLLTADYAFVRDNFSPPPLASAEEQAEWDHPPGSDLVAWLNAVGNSPVVVSDIGDSPIAYENPNYRRFVRNACRWLATREARDWAAQQVTAS